MSATAAEGLILKYGPHRNDPPDGPCCLVEAEVVHVLHRSVKADKDPTICPVIQGMATGLNDAYPDTDDGDRARTADLSRFLGRLANTKSTPEVERRRSHLACDWLVRTYTPAWLRLVPSLAEHAEAMTALPEIVDGDAATAAEPTISAAYSAADSAARSAARSAADSAARSAADSAADSAARSAARSAADSAAYSAADSAADSAAYSAAYSAADSAADSAAYSAARSAARSAAYSAADSAAYSAADSAARSAARSAAYSALQPTADELRASAIDLLDRMLAVSA